MNYSPQTNNPFVDAQFVKGIIGTDPIFDDQIRKHIAFVGRSNVGKSSVINAVLGRRDLVKSSSRPGKTTEINFFTVNEKQGKEYYFVDLPGYGFARMGEKQREKLRKLILWYFMYAEVESRLTVVVLDAQVGLTVFDREMLDLLLHKGEEVVIVANKIDRLNQKERHKLTQKLEDEVAFPVVHTSSTKKRGIDQLQSIINSA